MIRKAKLDDADIIADIIIKAWQSGFVGIVDDSYIQKMESSKYADIFRDRINGNKDIVLVYEDNSYIIGFASGSIDADNYCSELDGLYIYPNHQSQGIGTSLFKEIMSIFKQYYCHKMIVWTLLDARNNEFYIRHGGLVKRRKEYEFDTQKCEGVCFEYIY